VDFEDMEDEDDWDCSSGARILGISYSPDREEASYAALISPEGEVVDYVKLSYLLASRYLTILWHKVTLTARGDQYFGSGSAFDGSLDPDMIQEV
jgi:hypothetical protein